MQYGFQRGIVHRYIQVPSYPQDAGIQYHGRQLQAILAAWIRYAVCGSGTNLSGTDLHYPTRVRQDSLT
ncbi:hypothetical protein MKFW12EY_09210 [Methylomonas koyamae]|nr:hypothetical protein MKFW12EY_09210 [Methylomonas koyamae]